MVPKGWKKNSLDSLFEFKNGLNTEKEQYGNGYKFVNVMDVFRNDILTESKIIGRVQVTDKQLEGYQLKYGDVLFNRTSETFDEIAIAAIYLDNAIATFGGFVIRARPKGNQIDPAYSVFLFQSKSYRSQVVKLGQGAIRANIGQKDLARVCILVPPLAEQKKIAQILSTWDKAISVTEKLLANSQQQKKALMQQLLTGKKRLLDENGVRFSGEWKQDVNLGSIINISKGVQINKNTLSEDGQFPVINGGIAPSGFTSEFNTDENTITISEGGNSCGYVAFQKKSFWCGGHCYAVRKTALDLSFTFHLLKYNELKIMGLRVGSGLPNIQKKAIEAFTVNFPVTSVEQQKIAAVLSAADEKNSKHHKKLPIIKKKKKALMQQLLTGKRRVKVDEAVAE
ncbi:restriction endonuclease subunit S [Escherichia coli]|uniref:restriction endonuclease subunit S n=1 Tax=Escherichia coli TaxID=562 RepID=UPI0017889F37|nr:restriction endonuclease subunit S [Escherichia coli]MBE0810285.1 restriction endonuclease subunit S [Escherichia coli]